MYEELVDAINQSIEQRLAQVNTNLPATIVSYDAARNRAVVKVSIPKRLPDDTPLDGPQIVEVPILWPASNGGKNSFTMPLQPGDGIMLAVQQRSIENWLDGNLAFPDDPRQFDLSDSIGIAGCSYKGTVADPKDVVLRFNNTQIRVTPDDAITVGASNITLGNIGSAATTTMPDAEPRAFGNIQVANSDVTLARAPSSPLHASTKAYVDSKVSGGGSQGPPGPAGPPGPQGPPGDSWGSEAPQNHLAYGRMDAAWTRVLAITGDILDGGNF
jgi:hypothetical protein